MNAEQKSLFRTSYIIDRSYSLRDRKRNFQYFGDFGKFSGNIMGFQEVSMRLKIESRVELSKRVQTQNKMKTR